MLVRPLDPRPGTLALTTRLAGPVPASSPRPATAGPPVLGHAIVLAEGHGSDRTCAVWAVDPGGRPTGAWITRGAVRDRARAAEILGLTERRLLVAPERDGALDAFGGLCRAAGVAPPADWPALDLASALDEVRAVRSRYLAAVERERVRPHRREAAPPSFVWSLPDPGVRTAAGLAAAMGIAPAAGAPPLVARVLGTVRVLGRVLAAWRETEQAKDRRPYLRDRFGPPATLPPCWFAAAAGAYERTIA